MWPAEAPRLRELFTAWTAACKKLSDDLLALNTANDALGGNFLSRINMDLRETKGWSYGVRGGVNALEQSLRKRVWAGASRNSI